ncbi:recoverin 2 [Paramormyrops kingsleyae]|uniref:Recoverin 2 n=1 Tax=Paramormyrops kingsleyae TaxID=1676925 RepID=A0A3B3R8X9_9TELE|nr:visinin-like [Paramormyrops kingsleyae]XP_023671201.1 visinin-like [Paramormyrops kingsleyae]XP_023671202.1 visinin-like [Paramormyrops kingsleyae]XP_023671203.1 visinin-like [Paramormyrops kingsleyae]
MGNTKSSAMSKEILEDLKLNTKFSETELCQWYDNFQKQCPSGRISPREFEKIYERFFPDSDAKTYAKHVFRSFDTNDDGTLDFKEYIIALHLTSSGKMALKLEWAFSLFDVDKNGYITKSEVTEICQAIFKLIPKEEQAQLPEDENTPEKRANKLWGYFNKADNDKLAEGEFIKGVTENEDALRLIQYDPVKK